MANKIKITVVDREETLDPERESWAIITLTDIDDDVVFVDDYTVVAKLSKMEKEIEHEARKLHAEYKNGKDWLGHTLPYEWEI